MGNSSMGRATDHRLVREYGIGHLRPVLLAKPAFDCAGVAAGVGGMDFRTFFLATVAGKVLVKAPMQTAFAAASALRAGWARLYRTRSLWPWGVT